MNELQPSMKLHSDVSKRENHPNVSEIVKLLLLTNRGDVNEIIQHTNLLHVIFYHIQELFLNIYNDRRKISDVELFWHDLLEAVHTVLDSGLSVTSSEVFTTFQMNLNTLSHRSPNSQDTDCSRYTTTILMVASKAIDLHLLFWPKTINDSNKNFPILDAFISAMINVIHKIKQRIASSQYASFCHAISGMFCRIVLNIPPGEVSPETIQTLVDAVVPIASDEQRELLTLTMYLAPISNLHRVKSLPRDMHDKRIALVTLSKLEVLKFLAFPKAKSITKLPLPALLIESFLMESG